MAELDYEPYGPARALRQQRVRVWAVIIADVENPFFTSVVRGIEDVAYAEGYRLVLCNSDEDITKETEYLDIAVRERMAGVVIAAASTSESKVDRLSRVRHPGRRDRPRGREQQRQLGDGRQPRRCSRGDGTSARLRVVARSAASSDRLGSRRRTSAWTGYRRALTERGRGFDRVARAPGRLPGGGRLQGSACAARASPIRPTRCSSPTT